MALLPPGPEPGYINVVPMSVVEPGDVKPPSALNHMTVDCRQRPSRGRCADELPRLLVSTGPQEFRRDAELRVLAATEANRYGNCERWKSGRTRESRPPPFRRSAGALLPTRGCFRWSER